MQEDVASDEPKGRLRAGQHEDLPWQTILPDDTQRRRIASQILWLIRTFGE